jgi:hypothetical protein
MQSVPAGRQARILSFDEVRARLEQYWDVLADLPHRALARYKRHLAAHLAQPSGRLRSTAIHDFMIDELRDAAGDNMVLSRGRWLLRAANDCVLQCKKVDAKGRTSNYPTSAALEFETQTEFPGMPRGTRVTLGYRLNKEKTEVVEVCIVARDGNTLLWREDVKANQTALPIPVNASAQRPAANRLRPKKEASEARGVGEKKDKKHGG